jgi:hypothetical protein
MRGLVVSLRCFVLVGRVTCVASVSVLYLRNIGEVLFCTL